MDWESLREYANNPYVLAGATALTTGLVGYLFGRKSSPVQLARIDLEKTRELNRVELEKIAKAGEMDMSRLQMEENQSHYERDKDRGEIHRKREVENDARERQIQLEDLAREDAKEKEAREYKTRTAVDIASKIAPALEKYMDAVHTRSPQNGNVDPELLKMRDDYRRKLVDEYIEDLGDNEGETISSEGYNIDGDNLDRLKGFVDAKFPLPDSDEDEPELPEQLEELMDFIREVFPKKESE